MEQGATFFERCLRVNRGKIERKIWPLRIKLYIRAINNAKAYREILL